MPDKPLWVYYKVRWDFLTKLCASVPADPKIIEKWLESRQPKVKPPSGKSIDEIQEEVFATLPETEPEFVGLVFQREDKKLVTRADTVRAHMKDCARIISSLYVGKIQGEKSFATKIINGVYHDEREYWLNIMRPNGEKITESDGVLDKPVHARGPRGEPINAIKQFEWVQPAMMEFRLKVLGGCVGLKDLETLFIYGGCHGYAGERSAGEGRYRVTVTKEGEE